MFLKHPSDADSQPGSTVKFSIVSEVAITYIWYFKENPISKEDTEYSGSTTDSLTITVCLPKHKGSYKCVITDDSGRTHTSKNATLTIGEFVSVCVFVYVQVYGMCEYYVYKTYMQVCI